MSKKSERPSRLARATRFLQGCAHRRWFLPAVAVFPMADYVLPVMPNQMLLMSLSALQPRRWPTLAAVFAVSTAVGGALTTLAIQYFRQPLVQHLLAQADGASRAVAWVEQYGLVALAGLALLPWPPRLALIACAIAGLPWHLVGVALLSGRVIPSATMAFLGARSPRFLPARLQFKQQGQDLGA